MKLRRRVWGVWGAVGVLGIMACAVDEPLSEVSHAPLATGERGVEIEESPSSIEADSARTQRTTRSQGLGTDVRPHLSPEVAQRLKGSLSQRLTRSVDGLPRYTLPGVGDSVDTRGRFQHVVVQTRGADGQLHTECFESQAQLERALGAGAGQ